MDLVERSGAALATQARHPWEVARARHFVDIVALLAPGAPSLRVVDVGAGDAFLARQLLARLRDARVVAWDRGYTSGDIAALAQPRLEPTLTKPQGPFDVALLLDVLEHVADDAALLREAAALVRPGGAVVISVPAWPSLFALHDMKLRHLRRYTPSSARALVEGAGLRVERAGGLFHSLLPARALAVAVEGRTGRAKAGGAGRWRAPRVVTAAVTAALRADTLASRALTRVGVDAPGLSWWCVARRGK